VLGGAAWQGEGDASEGRGGSRRVLAAWAALHGGVGGGKPTAGGGAELRGGWRLKMSR